MFSLDAIARDDIEPSEARALLFEALEGAARPAAIYSALAQWTWATLTGRRFDEGLRGWHRLLEESALRLENATRGSGEAGSEEDRRYAERINALSDLVKASIHVASDMKRQDVLAKTHVMDVLAILARHAEGPLERAAIEQELGLSAANLSRVLTMMGAVGLVERHASGRTAKFTITGAGLKAVTEDVEVKASEARARLTAERLELEKLEREIAVAKDAKARSEAELQELRVEGPITQSDSLLISGLSKVVAEFLKSSPSQPGQRLATLMGGRARPDVSMGVPDVATKLRARRRGYFEQPEYTGSPGTTISEAEPSSHKPTKFYGDKPEQFMELIVVPGRQAPGVPGKASFQQSSKPDRQIPFTMRGES
ncbi:hypothetical protein [Allosediminivita pacifica]|uniref:Uncharacterized protein n=1 Tax=Allosediminivita pacifica TaxID=1267769 RepID=A0A2T5ZVV7_9RHOB|nr:hypothetical protein [Allosediminivita pacifica]PTX35684.1 hypothetical protein C8N44_1683 [Allosediminivita pacifica]GGB31160.1 hypothetical protein GCM10011324_45770 [Allosediminivita pacifica]